MNEKDWYNRERVHSFVSRVHISMYDYTSGKIVSEFYSDKAITANKEIVIDVVNNFMKIKDALYKVNWASSVKDNKQTIIATYVDNTGTKIVNADKLKAIIEKLNDVANDIYDISDADTYKRVYILKEYYTRLLNNH